MNICMDHEINILILNNPELREREMLYDLNT